MGEICYVSESLILYTQSDQSLPAPVCGVPQPYTEISPEDNAPAQRRYSVGMHPACLFFRKIPLRGHSSSLCYDGNLLFFRAVSLSGQALPQAAGHALQLLRAPCDGSVHVSDQSGKK